jgi:hypothetical protein
MYTPAGGFIHHMACKATPNCSTSKTPGQWEGGTVLSDKVLEISLLYSPCIAINHFYPHNFISHKIEGLIPLCSQTCKMLKVPGSEISTQSPSIPPSLQEVTGFMTCMPSMMPTGRHWEKWVMSPCPRTTFTGKRFSQSTLDWTLPAEPSVL